MNEAEVRTRIQELLKSGALPRMLPASPSIGPGLPTEAVATMQIGAVFGAICLACSEATPTVTHFYPSGLVVRLHDACEVIWREERERPIPRPS